MVIVESNLTNLLVDLTSKEVMYLEKNSIQFTNETKYYPINDQGSPSGRNQLIDWFLHDGEH